MLNRRVGPIVRRLRHRARLTQQALSDRCGVPRWKIGKLEADFIGMLRFDEVERCLGALGAELEIRALYRGAEVDRLLDEVHALVVGRIVAILTSAGWDVRVEVSFSERGERGSYDVLAWNAASRSLLVVEVKSELASIEATLRVFDVKVRLASKVARERFGWQALAVGRVLVLPEHGSSRRAVERHSEVVRAALPETSRAVRAWLRRPSAAIGGVWFVSAPGGRAWPRNPSAIQRIRPRSGDLPFVRPGQR